MKVKIYLYKLLPGLFFLFLYTSVVSQKIIQKNEYSNYFEDVYPESVGVESESILNFINSIEEKINELHSLIILKDGKKIASGWWAPYSSEFPHILHSLSKSFTSTAIGLAIEEGKLNLNDRVISFFPEYETENIDPKFKEMRVRDLLTMTTGEKKEISPFISKDKDWAKLFINAKLDFLPGTYYKYNSYATYMLSCIIKKITNQNLEDYLNPRLFIPLGIEKPSWEKCPRGISYGGWGLKLKTQDIAKFGQLLLQNGKWNGNQIISEDWIKMATSKQVENKYNQYNIDWKQGYGFQFWKNRYNSYRGDGAFGQYCIVIPDHKMVIAITGSVQNMQRVLDVFWEEIYSNLNSNEVKIDNGNFQEKLNEKLISLKIKPHNTKENKFKSKIILDGNYLMNPNELEIKSVKFEKVDHNYRLIIYSNSGKEEIMISDNKYYRNSLSNFNFIDNYSSEGLSYFKNEKINPTPVAINGYWKDKETFSIKILYLENTAKANLDLQFNSNEIEMEVTLKGVFASKTKFKLSGSK